MLVTGKHVFEESMRRSSLTQREHEVIKLLADGNTVKQAASMLGLSAKTVEAHKSNLMRKLHVHNKAQLLTVAIQEKMVSIPSSR
jgi:DNA-binding NarL/FixJ family response regulator